MQGSTLLFILLGGLPDAAWGIVGDQVPPPYPIVDIHIPEPLVGTLDKKWAAEDRQTISMHIAAAEQHLNANDELIKSQSESLAGKIDSVASLAQSIIGLVPSGPTFLAKHE